MKLPLPSVDPITEPYWTAASRGEFLLPRCRACDRFHHHPRRWCPHCWSSDLAWERPSGRGTVVTYSVVHQPPSPAFAVPYVLAVVKLDEGPQLMCNLLGIDAADVRCDLVVEVVFERRGEMALPQFRPVADARALR
ncbi:MAG: nucleic acid-binding protein [Panacagrimonas sp.]|nr:Zn-ribbon domain-containing OB-fold protein [Panacagrimonas sp.]MCC2656115.1 nucleic acid-binding protein [Panacagrimonas sp.]